MNQWGAAKTNSRLWEGLRGTLARLFGRVGVQEVPLQSLGAAVYLRQSDATVWPPPVCRERDWRLSASTFLWDAPTAMAGSGGADLTEMPCPVGADLVPRLDTESVLGAGVIVELPSVRLLSVGQGAWAERSSAQINVVIAGGVSHSMPVGFAPAPSHAVPIKAGGAGKSVKRDVGSGVPFVAIPAVRGRLSAAERVPMTVRRLAGHDAPEAFGAERRHLAAANHLTLEETTLLACFPHVPLARVQQMAVVDDGECLRVWLRSETASGKAGRAPGLVTIILGRRRSTGETLRAVLPETGPRRAPAPKADNTQ